MVEKRKEKANKVQVWYHFPDNAEPCLSTWLHCHTMLETGSPTWHWIKSSLWVWLMRKEPSTIFICCKIFLQLGFLFSSTRLLLKPTITVMLIFLELGAFQRNALCSVLSSNAQKFICVKYFIIYMNDIFKIQVLMKFGCSNTGINIQQETPKNCRVDQLLTCALSKDK